VRNVDDTAGKKAGPSDATNYSSTKAPETRKEAEEEHPHWSDMRLIPGGAHGAPVDPGMSSLDRSTLPAGGERTGQQDIGSTRGRI
jgi:hypothetical protein